MLQVSLLPSQKNDSCCRCPSRRSEGTAAQALTHMLRPHGREGRPAPPWVAPPLEQATRMMHTTWNPLNPPSWCCLALRGDSAAL